MTDVLYALDPDGLISCAGILWPLADDVFEGASGYRRLADGLWVNDDDVNRQNLQDTCWHLLTHMNIPRSAFVVYAFGEGKSAWGN
ncbi:hypothetical protein [Candidatus Palauibacter sp.]|uniref:hypothetical protein n=1 Tax=Candidatus Palauibacter sp. TaxID=3101350 RepID=UPI003B0145ED